MRIDLPDGQWAEIMPVDRMPARVRRRVRSVLGVDVDPEGKSHMAMSAAIGDEMKTALLAEVITAWSYDQPINRDTVEELPISAYDQLAEAAEEHQAAVNFSQPATPGANSSA
ncbi:hypothetical protein [Actinomadura harenae]|uniref:Tail assembly chaperone n=1 Tax=Actinomadura harenae TaxID=2483351 RepID=A0A3M2MJP7_9ACTN|nr:hypothetical protein [Actinomadura harenae]RMI47608.1 hypothetical protein EBO15_01520 [Actinomadura harenae]